MLNTISDLNTKNQTKWQILEALKNGVQVPEVLERIGKGETYESIADWLGHSALDRPESYSPQETYTSEGSIHGLAATPSGPRWTTVTTDESILNHLLELYFTWVHPVHTLFSKEHFMTCYKQQLDAFCSPMLVNAICAIACHLHCEPVADQLRFELLGDKFREAVYASIDANRNSITTAQTFGVMFLVELAQANAMRAASYINVALNSLGEITQHTTPAFAVVWTTTLRGLQSLEM